MKIVKLVASRKIKVRVAPYEEMEIFESIEGQLDDGEEATGQAVREKFAALHKTLRLAIVDQLAGGYNGDIKEIVARHGLVFSSSTQTSEPKDG